MKLQLYLKYGISSIQKYLRQIFFQRNSKVVLNCLLFFSPVVGKLLWHEFIAS